MRGQTCLIRFAPPTDVKKLRIFDPEKETGFLMEALRRTIKHAGPDVPVLGFAASPWTLACYMVEGRTKEGFATVKNFLYREPKVFRELLHKISKATVLYLKGQIAAGVSAVQLFDTWCGELNLADYTEFVLPAVQEIIAGLGTSVPVIYYTKASHHLLAVGGEVWRPCTQRGLARLPQRTTQTCRTSQWRCRAIWIRPYFSRPKKKFARLLSTLSRNSAVVGHILNLGHGILQQTPVENAQLFIHTGQQAALSDAGQVAQSRP